MQIRSKAFPDGGPIPRRFTCDGEDLSPPLQWSGVPSQARSLVILCDDPDAPGGTWHHWAIYDLPADRTELAEGASRADALKEAHNDFNKIGYGGPCPPPGHGPHHYHFRLLALSVDQLAVAEDPSCRDVEREARKHVTEQATLVGVFERK